MEQNEAKQVLKDLQESNSFSSSLPFEEYVDGLCNRYSRVYGEILNHFDFVSIVKKLKETKEI